MENVIAEFNLFDLFLVILLYSAIGKLDTFIDRDRIEDIKRAWMSNSFFSSSPFCNVSLFDFPSRMKN